MIIHCSLSIYHPHHHQTYRSYQSVWFTSFINYSYNPNVLYSSLDTPNRKPPVPPDFLQTPYDTTDPMFNKFPNKFPLYSLLVCWAKEFIYQPLHILESLHIIKSLVELSRRTLLQYRKKNWSFINHCEPKRSKCNDEIDVELKQIHESEDVLKILIFDLLSILLKGWKRSHQLPIDYFRSYRDRKFFINCA